MGWSGVCMENQTLQQQTKKREVKGKTRIKKKEKLFKCAVDSGKKLLRLQNAQK